MNAPLSLLAQGLDLQRASVAECWVCTTTSGPLFRHGKRWICTGCKAELNQEIRESAREGEE